MSNRYLVVLTVIALWLAVLVLAYIVMRELGWKRVRQYSLAWVILGFSLAGLPGAGFLKVAWPYKDRLLARIIPRHSPAVVLGGGCSIFPVTNVWNIPVRDLPLDPHSAAYVQSMAPAAPLHLDFSMPFSVLSGDQPTAQVDFGGNGESDPGPYRIPDGVPVEGGEDNHLIVLDGGLCRLYELYSARRIGPGQWAAGTGAIWDLRSNRLRPDGWTSADAAGLPILPGLLRYDEVEAGHIRHALRLTTRLTRRAYIWPARHFASHYTDPNLPPMGQRFRLRASYDISGFSRDAQVILTALKDYGMMLSDNGGNWFLTGAADSRFRSGLVGELKKVVGSDFEAVDQSGLMKDKDSGETR
jgi:hypothetical protein